MNRSLLLLSGLLLLPCVVMAQPSPADRVTGLNPAKPELSAEQVLDYLKSVRSARTVAEFETRGASRSEFRAHRIQLVADWEKPRNGGPPKLKSATIKPIAGGRLYLGDEKINKLTINSKGEIKVDRKGIDVTVYKITRKPNGDMVLDLPWWAGDKTIKKEDVFLDIDKWPPTLDELVRGFMNKPKSPNSTKHEGLVSWRVTGRADDHDFPVRGGKLRAASNFDIRGAGYLHPDGTFKTVGTNNHAKLTLHVGRNSHYRRGNGNMALDLTRGSTTFEGRYGISVPKGEGDKFLMTVDGKVDYALEGRNILLRVPTGARMRAGRGLLTGNGRLVGNIGPGGSSVVLRDGTYHLRLNGPMNITGLKTKEFTLDDLDLDGTIVSSGTIDELSSERLRLRGRTGGDVTVVNGTRGARGAILGETRGEATIAAGSKVDFDFEESTVNLKFHKPDGTEGELKTNLKGTLNGEVALEDLKVNGPRTRVDLERVTVTPNLEIDVARTGEPGSDWLRDARGTLKARVDRGGRAEFDALTGIPTVPNAGKHRTHKVEAGDDLHRLARKYGVPVFRIREANGIPAGTTDLVDHWGETLKIPGDGPQTPPSESSRGLLGGDVTDGTEVNLELTRTRIGTDGMIVEGNVDATVRMTSTELRASTLETKILGAAQASLARTSFKVHPDANGRYRVKIAKVEIPVRIDMKKGTRIHTAGRDGSPGREMDITLDQDDSYIEFVAKVTTDETGRLRVRTLDKVDLLLHSDKAATRFAGEVVDLAGDKSLRYTGRLEILDNGLDFFGDIAIISRGDAERPALRIRW